MSGQTTYFG